MIIHYNKTINFEIYVAEFIAELEPETIEDLEKISEMLHDSLEIGIRDFIESKDNFNYEDYTPYY
jgi:hypothetical protein